MVPKLLEKLILNGWAHYKMQYHAFGMFGRIPMPDNYFAVIVQIVWHPFLNQTEKQENIMPPPPVTMTWKDFFKFNEYQLKINSDKAENYYHFRNAIDWKWLADGIVGVPPQFNLDDVMNFDDISKYFYAAPQKPVILPTYILCNKDIKITISRNAYVDTYNQVYSPLAAVADEKIPPNGMEGVNTLKDLVMNTKILSSQEYVPPGIEFAGVTSIPRSKNPYSQDLQPQFGVQMMSQLTGLDSSDPTLLPLSPYITHPLVGFGIVYVDKNWQDKLLNG